MWIRHLTQNLGVNLAGVRILFELEERLGTRILERLYTEAASEAEGKSPEATQQQEHPSRQPIGPGASQQSQEPIPQAAAASAAKP